MLKKISLLIKYLNFCISSKSKYGIHSPAIYSLISQDLKSVIDNSILEIFRNNRDELYSNRRVIEVSHFRNNRNKITYYIEMNRIRSLARKISLNKRDGELLFRLIRKYKPETIIELGTGFGLSTLYMAVANPQSKIYTFEGCANKAEVASSIFRRNELMNISLLTGIFDKLLRPLTVQLTSVDFAFIDGDHTSKGMLNYFDILLPKCTEKTILVFHDIHWSTDMENGWKQLISAPEITATLDFFTLGVVFFDKKMSKQNSKIRI